MTVKGGFAFLLFSGMRRRKPKIGDSTDHRPTTTLVSFIHLRERGVGGDGLGLHETGTEGGKSIKDQEQQPVPARTQERTRENKKQKIEEKKGFQGSRV